MISWQFQGNKLRTQPPSPCIYIENGDYLSQISYDKRKAQHLVNIAV